MYQILRYSRMQKINTDIPFARIYPPRKRLPPPAHIPRIRPATTHNASANLISKNEAEERAYSSIRRKI